MSADRVYMLTAYAKADKVDLTPEERKLFRQLVSEIRKALETDDGR